MTERIRYKFLKPTTWPQWLDRMVADCNLFNDWFAITRNRYVGRGQYEVEKLYNLVAELNKAKSYYPLELEVIDNSVWVTVAPTPEITLAILTEQ